MALRDSRRLAHRHTAMRCSAETKWAREHFLQEEQQPGAKQIGNGGDAISAGGSRRIDCGQPTNPADRQSVSARQDVIFLLARARQCACDVVWQSASVRRLSL